MRNGIWTKGLVIGIILFFIGASALPSISGNLTEVFKNKSSNLNPISSKANILVYATEDGSSYIYDRTVFNIDFPIILENYGYTVTVTDRIMTPTITDSLLANYKELWILSSKRYSSGVFSSNEINTILAFRNAGNGLLIMADHYDYVDDANQISVPLGVTFFGLVYHGPSGNLIYPQFQSHPLFTGVTTIVSSEDDGKMNVNNPAQIVATYQGDNLIAILNNGEGKVVFDVTFTRLFNAGFGGHNWILSGDTPQYVKNIADWLNPNIVIGNITGGLFKVKAQIKNIGGAAATNVAWKIELTGGLIILGKLTTGTIATLAVNGTQTVSSKMIFGFGKTVVKVTADTTTKSVNATVLLVFIKI